MENSTLFGLPVAKGVIKSGNAEGSASIVRCGKTRYLCAVAVDHGREVQLAVLAGDFRDVTGDHFVRLASVKVVLDKICAFVSFRDSVKSQPAVMNQVSQNHRAAHRRLRAFYPFLQKRGASSGNAVIPVADAR